MEPTDRRGHNPLHHALDLFVYAPIGFLAEAPSLLPRFVRRGRDQVAVARAVGTYALRRDDAELEAVLDGHPDARSTLAALGLVARTAPEPDDAGPAPSTTAAAAPPTGSNGTRPDPSSDGTAAATAAVPEPEPETEPYDEHASSGLAIPDYESLSASQVIPRLESLTADELEAIRVYENENRARRTILSKIAQLQSS